MPPKKKPTPREEQTRLIASVKERIAKGTTTRVACKELGITLPNYYNWVMAAKRREATKPKAAKVARKKGEPTLMTITYPEQSALTREQKDRVLTLLEGLVRT